MADNNPTDANQVAQGGTAANREAQKTAVGSGEQTLAPGVPVPQPGGPQAPQQGSTGAGAANDVNAAQNEQLGTEQPVISSTHQMGVQAGTTSTAQPTGQAAGEQSAPPANQTKS
jgi:hypothetical protein